MQIVAVTVRVGVGVTGVEVGEVVGLGVLDAVFEMVGVKVIVNVLVIDGV